MYFDKKVLQWSQEENFQPLQKTHISMNCYGCLLALGESNDQNAQERGVSIGICKWWIHRRCKMGKLECLIIGGALESWPNHAESGTVKSE